MVQAIKKSWLNKKIDAKTTLFIALALKKNITLS